MPHHPNSTHDGDRHVPVEHRPGYFECERCGHRWIHRSVLPNGTTPAEDDIMWCITAAAPAATMRDA